MTHILIASTDVVGPQMAGPGIRALELARVLAREHAVVLAVPGGAPASEGQLTITPYHNGAPGAFVPLLERAEVVVGQGFVFEAHPELLDHDLPLAIDLYDPLILESLDLYASAEPAFAEAQSRRYLQLTTNQLRRGDFFFCATERQRHYWLGALTAAGRLTPALAAATDRELRGLIDLVPSGIDGEPPQRSTPVLRGVHPAIDEQSVLLVWAGGLWDWFDPLILVRAVAALRERCPHLRLCFFAGARPNPGGEPFYPANVGRVRELARALGVLDSNVLVLDQWIPYAERGRYLAEADGGVSAHLPGIETTFAFRTRLLDYLWARLPYLGTAGDSLGEQIRDCGGGWLVPAGDNDGWQLAFQRIYEDPAWRASCRVALEGLAQQYAWPEVARPLLRFCATPRRAAPPLDTGGRLAELEAALAERERYVRHVEREHQVLAQMVGRMPQWLQRLLGKGIL
jgi:glycosyltransferase involved in cell wall biosynthesis